MKRPALEQFLKLHLRMMARKSSRALSDHLHCFCCIAHCFSRCDALYSEGVIPVYFLNVLFILNESLNPDLVAAMLTGMSLDANSLHMQSMRSLFKYESKV